MEKEFDKFSDILRKSSLLKQQNFSINNRILKSLWFEEVEKIIKQRGIVFDIDAYSAIKQGEEVDILKINSKYWLNISIENIYNFLDFCRVHWFIPMIDKIYIDKQDISEIKELYSIIELALKNKDFSVFRMLYQELEKIKTISTVQWSEMLKIIELITQYNMQEYQSLLWNKVQKIKNIWVISENIFVELAMRLENEIRNKLGMYSTYIQLSSYKDDTENKQDMTLNFKKTASQNYQQIPIQFTTGGGRTPKKKAEEIKSMLFNNKKKEFQEYDNFCILSVNGKFKEAIDGELTKEYQQRVTNPLIREKSASGKQFPYFIDRVKTETLLPAKIMYIALHMLMKKYNFKNSTASKYLKSLNKNGKINKTQKNNIDDIVLSDITVENIEAKIEEQRITKDWTASILSYSCEVCYQGQRFWEIIIFAL